MAARDRLRRLARRMGYEIRQYTPLRSFAAAREALLERRAVDVVLDVGANAGQYGAMLRELGFAGRLVSLEPVAEAYAELERRAQADGAWEAVRVAASDVDGEITLNVTGDSRSSSVLPRNERFADKPGWAPKESRRVAARRLDGLVGELLRPQERAHLKLDIQGYERQVLDGAGDSLARFEALELELSVTPLYEGQAQLTEMLPLLAGRGFRPVCLEPILLDDDGLLMELDGLFART
ncbi:MAG: FkbM family methyltransferase [Thermoleophilaceae bacterium]|nr:FkbM family methyltransferase [Thermoleophilaceae bacterium]